MPLFINALRADAQADRQTDAHVRTKTISRNQARRLLTCGLDYLVAIRTPPTNSWKHPAQCVM